MTLALEAFHGTSLQAAKDIEISSYNDSDNEDDWLGRGVYFFLDGISDPLKSAVSWAEAQAWDNEERKYKYQDVVVLKSVVRIDEMKLLDLTSVEGLRNFNDIKQRFISRIFAEFKPKQLKEMSSGEHNCKFFNYMVSTFKAHAVKHNLYIKDRAERKLNLKLNVPNATVLCVRSANFEMNVSRVYEGKIK